MGFTMGFRPPFKFPGLWLYNGGSYPDTFGVVHIIGMDLNDLDGLKEYLGDRDMGSLEGTGSVDHMAFRATDLAQMRSRLQEHKITYRERTVPWLGLHQVFFEDPSFVTIELNYPAAKHSPNHSENSMAAIGDVITPGNAKAFTVKERKAGGLAELAPQYKKLLTDAVTASLTTVSDHGEM